jgi:hypothetical protein
MSLTTTLIELCAAAGAIPLAHMTAATIRRQRDQELMRFILVTLREKYPNCMARSMRLA